MPQAQTTLEQSRRTSKLHRIVSGFRAKPVNPSENLIEFIKVLEKVEVTPDKLAFNSKYMLGPDGSKIEY